LGLRVQGLGFRVQGLAYLAPASPPRVVKRFTCVNDYALAFSVQPSTLNPKPETPKQVKRFANED